MSGLGRQSWLSGDCGSVGVALGKVCPLYNSCGFVGTRGISQSTFTAGQHLCLFSQPDIFLAVGWLEF